VRSIRLGDAARCCDQPARASRREGGREVLHATTLGAHAREQEGRARHQLTGPRQVAWLGCPDHRANGAELARGEIRPPEILHERGDAFPHDALARELQILDVSGARVRGAHQHEHPRPGRARGRHERLDRVPSHQWVHRQQIGPEACHRPERRVQPSQQGGGVGLRGDCDVTALAVGDHQQAGAAGVLGHLLEHRPADRAERLEARQLQLHRDAGLRGRVDQGSAVLENRAPRGLRRRKACGLLGSAGRPQRARIGVQAEHDLRLTLGDSCGEGVAEGVRLAQRPFTALLSPLPAVKRGTRDAAIWMRSPVRGLTPARAPRSLTWNLPKPETVTSLPRRSASSTVASTASTAFPASCLVRAARSAT
jgi:hypothetical protein